MFGPACHPWGYWVCSPTNDALCSVCGLPYSQQDVKSAPAVVWRSIVTAPVDRYVLLWCAEDKTRWLATYQGKYWFGVDDMGVARTSAICKPTHWCELPNGPVT